MEKELVDLIAEKNFDQLNATEREALGEWCASEEEFQEMKDLFFSLEVLKNENRMTPKQETKNSLDDIFASTHAEPKTILWYNTVWLTVYPKEKAVFRRPLIQMAAAVVLLVLISPLFFQTAIETGKVQTAKNDVKPTEEPKIENELEKQTDVKVESTLVSNKAISQDDDKEVLVAQVEDLPSTEIIDGLKREDVEFASVAPSVAAGTAFDHPDGIFKEEKTIAFSQAAKDQPGFLDLLTATF
ncbi:MAG: hypothetical protein K9G40_03485 [Crocinitomicaceae bacterium]|nr:hypothetical protein [Crocinitomicaceae bacterium]MCF8433544.1 hypothetical protein [Crocinitomicaceae bacterium]